jgi:hypothetical protein
MVKRNNKLRICLVASAGGHLTQLLRLSHSWRGYEVVYVSTVLAVAKELRRLGPAYVVGECNRKHPSKALLVLARCIVFVLKHRPDIVISTGALPGFLLCTTARMFGALTQWPELAQKYRNVECVGAVI